MPTDYVTTQLTAPARPRGPDAARGPPGRRSGVPISSRSRVRRQPSGAPSAAGAPLAAERAFLAMCLASGDLGREYLARLREDHLSSEIGRRAGGTSLATSTIRWPVCTTTIPALAALVTGAAMEAERAARRHRRPSCG